MDALLQKLGADQPAIAMILIVLCLGLLDWLLGILDAIRNKIFDLQYLDVWVRTSLLGRILPIVLTLAFSQIVGTVDVLGIDLNLIWLAGQAAALAYALATIKSIADSVNPRVPDTPPTE